MNPVYAHPRTVERVTGIPREAWPGNAFNVASAIIDRDLLYGVAVYGTYTGPISRFGYWRDYVDVGRVPHGWIQLAGWHSKFYAIFDVCRWIFTNTKPHRHLFKVQAPELAQYVIGDRQPGALRCPTPALGEEFYRLELSPEARQHMQVLISEINPAMISASQRAWLLSLPRDTLAPFDAEIRAAIERAKRDT